LGQSYVEANSNARHSIKADVDFATFELPISASIDVGMGRKQLLRETLLCAERAQVASKRNLECRWTHTEGLTKFQT